MSGALTLNGQRVVVIGGSSGIGLAVARGALADGAEVVVASSGAARVEAAAAKLGAGARGVVVDVTDEASVAAFFEGLGALDHLVFTAGDWGPQMMPGPAATLDFATVGEGLKVRFWGAMMAVKHAQPRMSERGSIVLTDGVLAHARRRASRWSPRSAGRSSTWCAASRSTSRRSASTRSAPA